MLTSGSLFFKISVPNDQDSQDVSVRQVYCLDIDEQKKIIDHMLRKLSGKVAA